MPLSSTAGLEALARFRHDKFSRWPDGRKDRTRLAGIAQVNAESSFTLHPGEPVFTIGSCFARNIEARLVTLGFELPTRNVALPADERASDTENDLLNKYIPQSVVNELRWAFGEAGFDDSAFLEVKRGLWHDPHLAGNLADAPLERVRARREMVREVYLQLPRCRVVVMTLGLVEAWYDAGLGLYLNGQPPFAALNKEPERFRLDILSVDDVVEALEETHRLLTCHGHPELRIVLTVSPVPLKATFSGKDAITANTYSKSALRVAAEVFSRAHGNVDYFPSYEIVTHTPRGSAYIQDNRHVTTSVVNEIVDQVIEAYCPPEVDGGEDQPKRTAKHLNDLLKRNDLAAAIPVLETLGVRRRHERMGWSLPEYHLNFGKTLYRAGLFAQAQMQLARAVELEPDNALSNYNLGLTLNKLERTIEAAGYIRRAVELSPDSVDFRLRYARQLLANGDRLGAKAQESILKQRQPDYPGREKFEEELAAAEQEAAQKRVAVGAAAGG